MIHGAAWQPYSGVNMNDRTMSPQGWSPVMLSVLRIVAGLLFLQHGSAKLLHVPYQAMFAHLQLMSLLGVQGILELVGGALLAVGLFTRPVAFILSGDMAVAFFMVHFPKNWLPILDGGDLAVLFCFTFLYLCVAGPGPWSLDEMLQQRKKS
jgi:putative oxidoreductase